MPKAQHFKHQSNLKSAGLECPNPEALAWLDVAEEVEALRLAEKAAPGKSGVFENEPSESSDMEILLVVYESKSLESIVTSLSAL